MNIIKQDDVPESQTLEILGTCLGSMNHAEILLRLLSLFHEFISFRL